MRCHCHKPSSPGTSREEIPSLQKQFCPPCHSGPKVRGSGTAAAQGLQQLLKFSPYQNLSWGRGMSAVLTCCSGVGGELGD